MTMSSSRPSALPWSTTDDKLVYTESVAFDDMSLPLVPGSYTVQAIMANYPK